MSSGEVAFCRIKKTKETITEEGLENSSTELHPPGTVMLGMIGEGKTTRAIADSLKLSVKTVETYRENIKGKFGLSNSNELTCEAVRWVMEQKTP